MDITFPRIKEFKFDIQTVYQVPGYQVGRLDLISMQFYGNYRMYKAIASANNIIMPVGARTGIRPLTESIKNELKMKGYSDDAIESEIYQYLQKADNYNYKWYDYNNMVYGYMSDLNENSTLLIPTFESSNVYLGLYEYI